MLSIDTETLTSLKRYLDTMDVRAYLRAYMHFIITIGRNGLPTVGCGHVWQVGAEAGVGRRCPGGGGGEEEVPRGAHR